ncbi:cisplatin damage response ATP-dependent DNA ligase [Parvularcula maris]|uniref:DNA ligase (ATP) n=1 Tax=Parvularcula maris TaxID=2965077 RepID=A0A9X2L7Y2_9PROT|nr:cisplatin damage response ATP-dependent DNA ligase [Parvularcula maris]MCQ8184744.1 cisplatin damage response ATP-dependent DNA ligase [Parvularcula maris]
MNRFAELLDRLIFTPSRNAKVQLLKDYFADVPDPERGWAVAAITRDLEVKTLKPAAIKALVTSRVDPVLYDLSRDYTGDSAETAALIWPQKRGANYVPSLSEVIEELNETTKAEAPQLLERWLDALDPSGRWALIKLISGGLRIGVASRLVKVALAEYGGVEPQEIEELWHGLTTPYEELFAWLEGRAEKPVNAMRAPFRPVMLSHPVEELDKPKIDLSRMRKEWKWDGIRVQLVRDGDEARLYSRTGDDISGAFPDVIEGFPVDAAIDGELLIYDPLTTDRFKVRPFNDLQQRLNRKTVSAKMLKTHPAFVRAYDLLWAEGEDLRERTLDERRVRLEELLSEGRGRVDVSERIEASGWEELERMRSDPPIAAIEGVMLKLNDAPYLPGRPKGYWWKWKKEPYLVDAVLMYAQRGSGKRSSFYSDYTFGCWREGELIPVGKAYHGYTDQELKKIDKFVRDNTIDRFGPVRSVTANKEKGLVLEVAFEGLQRSPRHKSGVAMRFPRINRLRWDKPPAEADQLQVLENMLDAQGAAP